MTVIISLKVIMIKVVKIVPAFATSTVASSALLLVLDMSSDNSSSSSDNSN